VLKVTPIAPGVRAVAVTDVSQGKVNTEHLPNQPEGGVNSYAIFKSLPFAYLHDR
jgi:hypothetical protein